MDNRVRKPFYDTETIITHSLIIVLILILVIVSTSCATTHKNDYCLKKSHYVIYQAKNSNNRITTNFLLTRYNKPFKPIKK